MADIQARLQQLSEDYQDLQKGKLTQPTFLKP
jgi:hypothetical protein